MDDAGRWALLRRGSSADAAETLEHVAMTLLRRYGVVFWRLLEREADWLPSWRELLRTFHRLEARGEIRGGRFVSGLAGEQFALPEAIPLLREVRRRPQDGSLVAVCGVDPLNLAGTLLPGGESAGAGEQSAGVSRWGAGGRYGCGQAADLGGMGSGGR